MSNKLIINPFWTQPDYHIPAANYSLSHLLPCPTLAAVVITLQQQRLMISNLQHGIFIRLNFLILASLKHYLRLKLADSINHQTMPKYSKASASINFSVEVSILENIFMYALRRGLSLSFLYQVPCNENRVNCNINVTHNKRASLIDFINTCLKVNQSASHVNVSSYYYIHQHWPTHKLTRTVSLSLHKTNETSYAFNCLQT